MLNIISIKKVVIMPKIKKTYYLAIILVFFVIAMLFSMYKTEKVVEIYLPSLPLEENNYFDSNALLGKAYLLNVFNSWCTACIEEHAFLLSIKEQIPLYGIDYVDSEKEVNRFLEKHGNPYIAIGFDKRGVIQKGLNISGLPQSFLIDQNRQIIWKIEGMVTKENFQKEIFPLYQKLLNQ